MWVNPMAAVGDAMKSDTNLDKYAVELTSRAEEGKLDPVIGREEEMRRTIECLSRRTKNNPVLIGEPGVGKTAIAEGLARRIVEGEVPDTIKGSKVYALDLGALVAGTQYRGEFEKRFKGVLKEIEESEGNAILFVDEMHTLVGAGASEGSMDASNMLKPALARGDVQFIGATTLDEYRKHVEKDGALARRFQPVFVGEPTLEDSVSIMRGLKERYELHHGVKIRDAAVVAAAVMARRYVTGRKLPDSAIDLLDEAAARLRMQQESKPEHIADLERRILTRRIEYEGLRRETDAASRDRTRRIKRKLDRMQAEADRLSEAWTREKEQRGRRQLKKEEMDSVNKMLADALRKGDFEFAGSLKYQRLPALEAEIERLSESADTSMLPDSVGDEDVAAVVARHTGIPLSRLLVGERDKLIRMEEQLRRRVVGQDHALEAISNAVRVSRAGLHKHDKPIGSFLFLGPSGVGKTELAKGLAEFMFDDASAVLRIDCSEYMERISVSRLIGAAPGYVGYEEGGALTEPVRRRPYQVVLFDEAEKAHPAVMNLLLQLLDEGHLSDMHGRRVDFRNAVVIMTSNLGAGDVSRAVSQGVLEHGDEAGGETLTMDAVRRHFPPELINRLDNLVVFRRLTREAMAPIVDIQLDSVRELLREKRVGLDATQAARDWLAREGYDPEYGARPMKRAVQASLLNPLAVRMLADEVPPNSLVTVGVADGGDKLSFGVSPLPPGAFEEEADAEQEDGGCADDDIEEAKK